MPIKDYSTNPNNNNASPPNGAPEGMNASDINNVIRQVMADIRSHAEQGGWTNWNHTPTYIDTKNFTVTGDKRDVYTVGRMVKVSLTGQDVFSAVAVSKLSGNNTQITLSDNVLNNSMAEVYLGVEPEIVDNYSGADGLCIPTTTNNGNTIVLTPVSGRLPSPRVKGQQLTFFADSVSTGNVTINGQPLYFEGKQLPSGFIQTGQKYKIEWSVADTRYNVIRETKLLPTTINATESGKFFVRKADGSLPNTIDSTKVWSLADQQTALGGTAPTGKNHIELPVGVLSFGLAGGGGGGSHWGTNNGSDGGNTTFDSVIATGGRGGLPENGHGSSRDGQAPKNVTATSSAMIRYGHGGKGGQGSAESDFYGRSGASGEYGNVVIFKKKLDADFAGDFVIGDGGTGGISTDGKQLGQDGEKGWLEINYV